MGVMDSIGDSPIDAPDDMPDEEPASGYTCELWRNCGLRGDEVIWACVALAVPCEVLKHDEESMVLRLADDVPIARRQRVALVAEDGICEGTGTVRSVATSDDGMCDAVVAI